MAFNLIEERWIPVRTRSGRELSIAPWEITKVYEPDPVAELNAPRPDFNGALIQFLIGLVQTCAAPKDEFQWEEKLEKPMEPDELHDTFSRVSHAFNLDGDGPRFMQDLTLNNEKRKPLSALLIESPGENTLRDNADHFVKRDMISAICNRCSAAALFTLQTNAPGGGSGHRTSLRGGGPLTTLVLGEKKLLWQTVWLNTLPNKSFLKATSANVRLTDDSCLFPWLGPTRTSERGRSTTPLDGHPAQVFWGMPRRIRLDFAKTQPGYCDICHSPETVLVRWYTTKNYGVNYEGAWRHPLTPYSQQNKDGFPLPRHAQPGGISYRHWIGLVQEDLESKSEVATVVNEFRSNRQNDETAFRLWAFGFDMDQMKARCWYESTMPLIEVGKGLRSDYEHVTADLILAAKAVAGNLVATTKWALYGQVKEVKGNGEIPWKKLSKKASKQDLNLFHSLSDRFWKNTEPSFYQTLNELKQALEKASDHKPIRKQWHTILYDQSLKLFDECLLGSPIEDAEPKRIALARISLQRVNRSKKITRDLLKL